MSVVRIYDLAKELSLSNGEILSILKDLGESPKSASSTITEQSVEAVKSVVAAKSGDAAPASASPNGAVIPPAVAAPTAMPTTTPVDIPAVVSLRDFADLINVPAPNIQKKLMALGVLASLNQKLSPEVVARLAKSYGVPVSISTAKSSPTASSIAAAPVPTVSTPVAAFETSISDESLSVPKVQAVAVVAPKPRLKPAGPVQRPPVVTIMGHVDHGKTTLLDTIRSAKVADGEHGGITQSIGAYQVEIGEKDASGVRRKITFLDTPGHEAFTSMRARGAQVTDIAILVVAADDGIMPQTIEAINHAKAAQVPIIVAVNKIDKDGANPTRVLTQLMEHDIMPEAYGGTVQTVEVSAKQNLGIDDLLEAIILVADAEVDPKADPSAPATGTIIEAELDRGRGVVATVLVDQGTVKMGDSVVAGVTFGKIKAMLDDRGQRVVSAGPARPVVILGLNSVPGAGDRIEVVKDEKTARQIAEARASDDRQDKLSARKLVTLEDLQKQLKSGSSKELNLIVKADMQGSVEAIRQSLEKVEHPEVQVKFIASGVGAIGESDVLLASASQAIVVGFSVRVEPAAVRLAEAEHVEIREYRVIYDLFDDVKRAMAGLLDPIFEESALGTAEVRAVFKLPRSGGDIAGSYITDGKVVRGSSMRVRRAGKLIFEGKVDTLKREKNDAREVAQGYECGILVPGYTPIEGDLLECYEMKRIERTL